MPLRFLLPLVTAAWLTVAAPAAAQRGVVQAENILPPGQSGYVSIPGVASGTGSPHLFDQLPLFTRFDYKSELFGGTGPGAGGTEEPRAGVRIARDAYGVPSVTAGSETDAWWGVGWAVAEDRLFQIELFRRATTGRLAEILGRGYLDDDLIARRDYYTRAELERMFGALPQRLLAAAAAYRDGINAYIAYLRTHPDEIPGEFVALGVPLTEIELWEQAAIGVFLARTVPSGNGNELANLRLLRAAGKRALDALVPIRQRRETYTIPPSEGRFPSQPGRTRRQERRAFRRSARVSRSWDLPSAERSAAARAAVAPGLPGRVGGSSMFAVRDRRNGRAYLFNGPQLGYSVPELFVEIEVHYPGFDARGVTAAAIPLVAIGHNGRVAWGYTSGLSDEDDLYAESLVGGRDAERYRFKGDERGMDCRDERFAYSTPLIDVTGGTPPESGTVTERICRTVHGPVQLRAGDTAYARRYAIWGREVESLVGLDALSRARSIRDVDRAMNQVTWNENVMAADADGNIGYWHPGLHQLRPRGFDERLPYPGTGEAEWRGLRDRRTTPRVINPRQGWLSNWNNLPAKGWTTGDAESNERLSGKFHRGEFLARTVRVFAKDPSYEGAKRLISYAGTTAQQRPLAQVRIRRAAARTKGPAKQVLDALLAWPGSYHRTDDEGTVDPGVAIWEELKDQLERAALRKLSRDIEALAPMAGHPGSSHAFDISNGEAYALRTLTPREWRRPAAATFAALRERFGTDDISRWREPRRMYDWTVQGAASPPPIPFFDRGTWEHFVELGPTG